MAALRSEGEKLKSDKARSIFWLTDSKNLVQFLTKGSSKADIQRNILLIFGPCRDLQIDLIPIHLHRDDYRIQVADHGSRFVDQDDWAIDQDSYQSLTQEWIPTVDLFAHFTNKKCAKFYSYGKTPHTSGVDAFTRDWSQEIVWCCPPVNKIIADLQKVESTHMMCIWSFRPGSQQHSGQYFFQMGFMRDLRARRSCSSDHLSGEGNTAVTNLCRGAQPFPSWLSLYDPQEKASTWLLAHRNVRTSDSTRSGAESNVLQLLPLIQERKWSKIGRLYISRTQPHSTKFVC